MQLPPEQQERLCRVFAQVMGIAPDEVAPGLSPESCGAWTSLSHLMLVSEIESTFGIVFSSQEIQELTSYGRIAEVLEKRVGS